MADISPAAPDFRKLCDEQLPELRGMFERILCVARSSGGPAIGNIQLADRLIDAVVSWSDAALAQPEPEGLTDEELMQLLFDNYRDDIEFVCDAEEEAHVMANSHVKFARAVLTRWGRPAIKPVPVSERLPGAEDCDAEGRCWWGDAGGGQFVPSWRLCQRPDNPCFTHWRPYHALPVPQQEPSA